MSDEGGLRERKKAATRTALCEAAVRLAVKYGIDRVTTDAIAAAAQVAPRTFRNYFSCKEEAIVAPLLDQARGFADLIRSRPADEPVWDSVRFAAVTALSGPAAEVVTLKGRHDLFASSPALAAQFLTVFEETERLMAQAIADRIGVDVQTNPYPRLQAGVVVLALKTVMEFWHQHPGTVELPVLAGQAIDYIRAGLPQPTADFDPECNPADWSFGPG